MRFHTHMEYYVFECMRLHMEYYVFECMHLHMEHMECMRFHVHAHTACIPYAHTQTLAANLL
jgi:hypothetical protein